MSFSGSFNLASSGFFHCSFLDSVQFSPVTQSCLTLATPWTAACQASLSITNTRSLLKLIAIKSVTPSNHFILCCPILLLFSIFPSIRVFSNESVLHIRWPKFWSFSISPSSEYSGLISFRMNWFDLLVVQGTLKSLLKLHSSKASILWCSVFFLELPHSSVNKESAYNAGDPGSIPEWERSAREGNGNLLQYSCLENLMDRGAWWTTVYGVTRVRHNLATKPPSVFFMVQFSHPYMTTGKTIALTIWTFVYKVMSLLFNMLSRLVIAFLPRSKCL